MPVSELLLHLMEWSKGYHLQYSLRKVFTTEKCITSLELITGEDDLHGASFLTRSANDEKLYLKPARGGESGITDIKLAGEE